VDTCYTSQLFRPLHSELLKTLRALDADAWNRQTLAPQWKVRDVAAHLLDNDLRKIAVYRDGHLLPPDPPITSERDLTEFINRQNASGVAYAARLSPALITDLLDVTGGWVADLVEGLPPHGRAIFAVSWAGEAASENWMDTGREYTERWHHQMQIRDATDHPLLLSPEWMTPLLDMSVRALPHAYRAVDAPAGASITVSVTGETTGAWTLRRQSAGWQLTTGRDDGARATVHLPADTAWRVLYNAPYDRDQIRVDGDAALAAPLLRTRSVIV
jgi:uncharacterized protein (TIGR03083 family)